MDKFKELEKLNDLKAGQVITLSDTTAEEVREHIKQEPNLKSSGHRIVEVGTGIVTVVKTQGRVSSIKKALTDRIKQMHPFERVHIEGYRLQYVRGVLKEIYEATGQQIHCGTSVRQVEGGPEIIEIFKDPFTSWSNEEQNMQEMIKSFVKQTSDHFACGERDVINQFELIYTESTEEATETAESTDEEE